VTSHPDRRDVIVARPPAPGLSFSERYRAPPPAPWWRRLFSPRRLLDLAEALVAVGLLLAVLYLAWLAVTWSGHFVAPPRAATPAAPAGTELLRLRTSDGVALRAWFQPAAGERAGASERALILVHDWGRSATELLRASQFLRDEYAIVAVELRGHGTDGVASTLGVAERHDVAAAVAAARRAGAGHVGVLGIGMGAVAAIGAADDDRTIGAVLADSPYLSAADLIASEVEADGLPASRPGNWAVLLGLLFRTGADVTAGDAAGLLERTRVPTLVVAGARDPLLPEDALDALERAASPLSVWTVPAARHGDTRRVAGDAYVERVRSFFDEHLASR